MRDRVLRVDLDYTLCTLHTCNGMGETKTDQSSNKSNFHARNGDTGYPGLTEIINQGTWYLVFTDNREARANADNFLLSGCVM